MKFTARERLSAYGSISRTQSDEETYDMRPQWADRIEELERDLNESRLAVLTLTRQRDAERARADDWHRTADLRAAEIIALRARAERAEAALLILHGGRCWSCGGIVREAVEEAMRDVGCAIAALADEPKESERPA